MTPKLLQPLPSGQALDPRLLSYAQLGQLPTTSWLIKGKIQARALNVLFGASETCKTLLAILWALEVAQVGPVVIVAGEGLHGLHQRIEAVADYYRLDPDNVYVWREPIHLMKPQAITSAFIKHAAVVRPLLVVIDTLARCMAGGNESTSDMSTAVDSCGKIIQQVGAVLLLHHEPRNAKHERGHTSLRGAADIMLRTERKKKDPLITLTCEKSKDAEPFASERYQLTPHLRSVVLCHDGSISGHKVKILRALNSQKSAPLSKLEAKTKIARRTLLRLLDQLKKSGDIRQPKAKGPYELAPKGRQALSKCQGAKISKPNLALDDMTTTSKCQTNSHKRSSVNGNHNKDLGDSKCQVPPTNFQLAGTDTIQSANNLSLYRRESGTERGTESEEE